MAKRDTGGVPRSFGVPGFSLESILEECRDKAPEETAAPETAETEYRPETEGCSSEQADYPAETEYEAEYPDEEAEYPEYEEFDTGAPEYETEPDTAPDEPEETGEPAAAIQLPDGGIVTGKTSELMGASSAALLNALKALAGIGKQAHLISRAAIEPIQSVKVRHLGSHNPRLHSDEILIALAISAATDPLAAQALDSLSALRDCEAHSSVILSSADSTVYQKLGLRLTCSPRYQTNRLYHK